MRSVIYTCIVCPRSCDVTVSKGEDGKLSITGFECKRGYTYAENEFLHPMRMITSTVTIRGGNFKRLGVIGTAEVPKDLARDCLQEIYRISFDAPVRQGDILIENILGTGCNIVAAMSMKRV